MFILFNTARIQLREFIEKISIKISKHVEMQRVISTLIKSTETRKAKTVNVYSVIYSLASIEKLLASIRIDVVMLANRCKYTDL